jgi:GH25 family lysozyme M1 (1,4-beta-N-acetylmuramidase)
LDFGFVKATESTGFTDTTFAANWANLLHDRLPRGAYHFFHPGVDPVAQANHFVGTVKAHGLEHGDMLVADVEITSGAEGGVVYADNAKSRQHVPLDPMLHAGLNLESVNSAARIFLDHTQSLAGSHCPVLVYTNLSVGRTLGSCTHYDLWIAYPSSHAPADVSPWHNWRFWQWEFGGGIGGGDRDAYNGTTSAMNSWLAPFKGATPPKPPQPKPPTTKLLGEPMLMNRAPDGTDPATKVDIRTPLSIPAGTTELIFTSNGDANISIQFTGLSGRVGPWHPNIDIGYNKGHVETLTAYWHGAVLHRNDPGSNDVSVACSA